MPAEISIEDVKRLRLEDGDTLVLKCKNDPSPELLSIFARQLHEAFPGHRTLVLDTSMDLEVVPANPVESGT